MSLAATTLPEDFDPSAVDLSDRVVLVTGATGDVGQALCPALAAAGATVILAGRNVPKLERLYDRVEAAGPQPAIIPADLAGATAPDYEAIAETVTGEFGRLDGLVHLAGDFDGLLPLAQTPADRWMISVQVNLNAVFLLGQALQPALAAADRARIVVVLEDPDRTSRAYWGAYGVCQAARAAFTAMAAAEFAASGIEVNGLCPPPLKGRHRGKYSMSDSSGLSAPGAVVPSCLHLLDWRRPPLNGTVLAVPGPGA